MKTKIFYQGNCRCGFKEAVNVKPISLGLLSMSDVLYDSHDSSSLSRVEEKTTGRVFFLSLVASGKYFSTSLANVHQTYVAHNKQL